MLLGICAGLEEGNDHALGQAVLNHTKAHERTALPFSNKEIIPHAGVYGIYNNARYAIGGTKLMEQLGVTINVAEETALDAGESTLYVARDNTIIARIIYSDLLRKDAIPALDILQKMGKTIHLCTGSDLATASRYAQLLNIKPEHIAANCVPYSENEQLPSKVNYIKQLKQKGHKVAMIGDAANDTTGIAESDFGFAILSNNSHEKTQELSGVIIQEGRLMAIPNAFVISQQTVTNIRQNLVMNLGYNLISVLVSSGLFLGIGICMNPAVGVALMAIQACLLMANVHRFKQQTLEHLEPEKKEDLIRETSPDALTQKEELAMRPAPANEPAAPVHFPPLVLFGSRPASAKTHTNAKVYVSKSEGAQQSQGDYHQSAQF
jgi:Cu2+-exporting ATPase